MSLRSGLCSLVALLGACVCAAAGAAIPSSERDALIALFNATDGAHWKDNSGWNGAPGTECDAWYGVHCDEAGSTVVDIELGDNNLAGTLPSLAALPNLQGFVVYSNSLTGSIPSLSGLRSLALFDVNTNQLSGALPSLAGLTALTYVDIDGNQLSGTLPAFTGLANLQYFDAHSNQFDHSIPALSGLASLQTIDLSANRLTGNIPALSGLAALQRFDFSDNQLSGPIPDLSGLPSLQGFAVRQNQLSGHIPSFAALPPTVSFIGLSANNLDGPIPALSGLTSLAFFDAIENGLDGSLPALNTLTNLQGFSVTSNKLTGNVPALNGLSKLEQFAIDDNQLEGPLPPLGGLVSLQGFYAGTNKLSGNLPTLAGLSNLRSFFVDDNALTGNAPSLQGVTQLQYFGVSNNKLGGPLPDLSGLSGLIYFDASYNQFNGPIPSLSGLLNLQTVYLGFNQLSGSVPSLAGLSALQTIAVDDNRLDGTITAPFTGLANLQDFIAGNNQLQGSIPALAGLTQLVQVDVSGNALTGTLPALAGLTKLERFNASYNSIGGPIPALAGLTSLQEFFVGFNQLDGAIPALAGLTNLRFFAVDDNQLDGQLPVLAGLNNLIVFLAASNTIEGTLPSLNGLSNLQLFEVGNNRVSGNIPAVPSPDGLLSGLSSLCPNNLVPSANPAWDDATGETPWYSTCSSNESQEAHGTATTKDSTQIAFSSDASVEVFQSQQTDLTANAGNAGGQDIYSFGADGETVLESIDSSGTKMVGMASLPAISPDGSAIAFVFTPAAAKGKDLVTGQLWAGGRGQPKHQVDVGMGGVPANGTTASAPTLSSSNGTTQLAFCSAASNLVPNDANTGRDIFLVDPLNTASAPQRISVDATGKELPGDSCEPKLSSDGSKLVFSVSAAPLFGTAARQIVLKELGPGKVLLTGQFLPITTNTGGQGASADSSEPTISQDGSVIAFTSAANLDGVGTPVGGREVFISLKQPGGRLIRRARSGDGTVPDGASQHPQLTADGTALVMQTAAKNFLASKSLGKAAGDAPAQCGAVAITTNFLSVHALGGPLCSSDGKTLNQSPAISGDGGTSGFDSNAAQSNGNTNRNAFAQGIGMPSGITALPANLSGDYSGQWFDPSQNGQGLVLDVLNPDANNNRLVLLTWFVFANGQPTWVQGAGVAHAGSGTAQNTVVVQMDQVAIFQGKSFPLGEARATATLWGSITLTFTDANTGKMSWRSSYPGFSSGSMPIRHFIAVSLPANDVAGANVKSCYSGNWFNPAQAGHGFEFEVLPTTPAYLAVDWFAFAPDGSPVWLQGVGQISGNSAQMHLQLIDGPGALFPPNYNPDAIVQHDWGTATFTFSDAAHGSVSWNSTIAGYGAGTQPLQPIVTGLMDRRGCQ